ncbi:MAG: hypothetical protein JJU27_14245 [Gammaproteobacteria bacterium]|nr:hypothetical protein [Gammaproteobacteria bacterium]
MAFVRSQSGIERTVGWLLFCLLLISATVSQASAQDQPTLRANAVDWSGTQLSPRNDAPVGSQLAIRPPAGARLPRVAVQLAGQTLRIVSASPEEVRVQLPAQPVTGALTMTNVATRLVGTLEPEFRVVTAAPRALSSGATAGGRTTAGGGTTSGGTQPRTLSAASLGPAAQQMSGHGYLRILASGEDAPVLFGEDNTQSNQGTYDVSGYLEVLDFTVALHTGQQGTHGSSQSTGHRVWHPARFVVRLGKSTPWLFEAARTNKNIDLTLFLFHRHHQSGIVEQNFQYRIGQGRIVSVRIVKPPAQEAAATGLPVYVELMVTPNVSEMESQTGGTVMVDDWANYGA